MKITIETIVNAPLKEVWMAWTSPDDITQWNFATEEWICPNAEIDLTEGGGFNYRMEAKDGSMGFDFVGKFTAIKMHEEIVYALEDQRKVITTFTDTEGSIKVEQSFDAEDENSGEQQKQGWQSILNNFKQHTENKTN